MSLLDEIHKKSTYPLIIYQNYKGKCALFWELRTLQLCSRDSTLQAGHSPVNPAFRDLRPFPQLSVAGECVDVSGVRYRCEQPSLQLRPAR